jgi:hypothetical protein
MLARSSWDAKGQKAGHETAVAQREHHATEQLAIFLTQREQMHQLEAFDFAAAAVLLHVVRRSELGVASVSQALQARLLSVGVEECA